jgi:hypothetical protein
VTTLITAAILAGAGFYAWHKTRGSLTVTEVSVAAPKQEGTKCGAITVKVTGTIVTNGHGGVITYQWLENSAKVGAPAPVTAGSGQDKVPVTLNWTFHGAGTQQGTVVLKVLSPNPGQASAVVKFSCTS